MAPKRAVAVSASKTKTTRSTSRVQKATANPSGKLQAAKKSKATAVKQVAKKSTATAGAKSIASKKSKSKTVPAAPVAASKKRKAESEPVAAPLIAKRQRLVEPLNVAPSQKLEIYVFGTGEYGELGLGHVTRNKKNPKEARRPRLNDLLDVDTVGVVQVAVGGMHCVALTHDGKILTWGVNDNGALGRDTSKDTSMNDENSDSDEEESDLDPKESTPTAISAEFFNKSDGDLVQVAATDSASFVLTSNGLVYGWGTFTGSDGNIGFSKTVNQGAKSKIQKTPSLIPQLKKITSLVAGGNHMLALDSHGAIFAWGCGQQSQLGRPIMESYRNAALTPSLVRIARARGDKSKVTSVAAGQFHSFALTGAGDVYAWGLNNFAQTGIAPPADNSNGSGGEEDEDAAPLDPASLIIAKATLVAPLSAQASHAHGPVTAIAGGTHHSLALTSSGRVLCWGRCDSAQAGMALDSLDSQARTSLVFDGRGNARILAQPTPVPELHDVAHVAAGIDNAIVVTRDGGAALAWGFGANYRTGLGTEEPVVEPRPLTNSALVGRRVVWAACGGQFSVLAAVPALED